MKRAKVKRLLAMGMAVLLGVSLMGCQGGDESPKGSASVSEKDGGSDEKGGASAEKEPVVITWGSMSVTEDGILTDKHPIYQQIKDELGIEIEWVMLDEDKYNVLASGGDLPDIISVYQGTLGSLIDNQQLLELSDLLENYGQDTRKRMGELSLANLESNYGGIYCLPISHSLREILHTAASYDGFKMRMDIYHEIGAPEMENEDDLLNVIKQMQDYERERTGENDIYGIGSWNIKDEAYCVALGHGYYSGPIYGSMLNLLTGDVEPGITDPDSAYWQGIEFFNKAWKMGLIDPNDMTAGEEYITSRMQGGKIMGMVSWGVEPEESLCGENAFIGYMAGPFRSIPDVYSQQNPLGNGEHYARAISSNCKNPERAMQLLNYLDTADGCRLAVNGCPGIDWEYDDSGKPVFIGEMKKAYEEDRGAEYKRVQTLTENPGLLITSTDVFEDGYPASISSMDEWALRSIKKPQRNFAKYYDESFDYPGQVYDMWVKEGKVEVPQNNRAQIIRGYMTLPSEEAQQIYNEAENSIMAGNYGQLVMAEDFEHKKAEVIQQLKDIGMEQVDQEVQEIYQAASARYEEMLNSTK